jgi:hypothetical protein
LSLQSTNQHYHFPTGLKGFPQIIWSDYDGLRAQ